METKDIDFAAIPQTALRVLTQPAAFFKEMPKSGGFIEPLVFMVVMGVASGIIQAIISLVGFNPLAGMAAGLAALIIMPLAVAVFGFVGAAILFVIWKLMGSAESYETAYRAAAYLSVLMPIQAVLGIVPYLGVAAGMLLYLYYTVIASVEVHGIPAQKAWLVFGIITAAFFLMQITAEIAARRMAGELREMHSQVTESAKQMGKQSEAARKAAEEMQKMYGDQADEAKKAAAAMKAQLEEMQQKMK